MKKYLKSTGFLVLSLVLCPFLAIFLLIKYDYPMGKKWERVLGAAMGCYIAIIGYGLVTYAANKQEKEAEAEKAKQEAQWITVDTDTPNLIKGQKESMFKELLSE